MDKMIRFFRDFYFFQKVKFKGGTFKVMNFNGLKIALVCVMEKYIAKREIKTFCFRKKEIKPLKL